MKLLDLAKASAVNLYAHLPLAVRRQEMTGYIFGLMAGFFTALGMSSPRQLSTITKYLRYFSQPLPSALAS